MKSKILIDKSKIKKKIEAGGNFCLLPFIQISSRVGGAISPCCKAKNIGDFYSESLLSAWNNDAYKKIRKEFLEGKMPEECLECRRLEMQGGLSYRISYIRKNTWQRFLEQLDFIESDYSMPNKIKIIDISYSALCNLKCRMCNCHKEKFNKKIAKKNKDISVKNLEELAPSLEIVRLNGGEPFMNPDHDLILEKLLPYAHNISLEYNTNLSFDLFKFNSILEKWKKFKEIMVVFSLDGTEEVNNYIRVGVNFEKIASNINICAKHSKVNKIICSFTFQALNSYNFAYFLREMSVKYPTVFFHGNILKIPDFLSVSILPPSQKKELINIYKILREDISKSILGEHIKETYIKVIDDFINFLYSSKDNQALIETFINYNFDIDKKHNLKKDFREIVPELKNL